MRTGAISTRFALAAAVVAAVALWGAATAGAAAVVPHEVAQSPRDVREHWTPERMQAADPAVAPVAGTLRTERRKRLSPRPGDRTTPTSIPPSRGAFTYDYEPGPEIEFPQRVHGKVFFTTVDGGGAMCSGTLVSSRLQDVVFTAGHCVSEGGQFVTNLIFIPGYRDGQEPFGAYPAAGVLVHQQWLEEENLSYDAAVVQLGVPLEAQLGARGVVFNKSPKTSYQIFGYPARPDPYDGERLIACDASFYALEYTGYPFSTVAAPCNMMQGSSGGGWVVPTGQVASVVSHGSCDFDPSACGQISGPYFGDAVKALYNRAGGSAQCPPATKALKRARKKLRRAKRASTRTHSKRATRLGKRRLRKSKRVFTKAKARHEEVC
jgi:hypothetical protein